MLFNAWKRSSEFHFHLCSFLFPWLSTPPFCHSPGEGSLLFLNFQSCPVMATFMMPVVWGVPASDLLACGIQLSQIADVLVKHCRGTDSTFLSEEVLLPYTCGKEAPCEGFKELTTLRIDIFDKLARNRQNSKVEHELSNCVHPRILSIRVKWTGGLECLLQCPW